MPWNYRIIKRKTPSGEQEFAIYEVYYDDNGNLEGWADNPITPICPSEAALHFELHQMLEAFKKDTLTFKED